VTRPAPEQESDVVALIVVAAATLVDPSLPPVKSLAPDATEVEKNIAGAEHDTTKGPRVAHQPSRSHQVSRLCQPSL
jgi:hypothetical protein